ncbi:DNA-binding response OmpR family regulator [Bradyrhizobium sp. USDA 4516]
MRFRYAPYGRLISLIRPGPQLASAYERCRADAEAFSAAMKTIFAAHWTISLRTATIGQLRRRFHRATLRCPERTMAGGNAGLPEHWTLSQDQGFSLVEVRGRGIQVLRPRMTSFGPEGRSDVTCLLVDDDHDLRNLMTNYLGEYGVRVVCASRPREVAPLLVRIQPDLILLDLQLGQECGLDLLRELRALSSIPIIIITGRLRDEADRVVGLELGADDYINKPFSLRELLARIRAVLRGREAGLTKRRSRNEAGHLCFGGWRLERRTRRLTNPRGDPVALTKGEYALLRAFLEAPQRPLSREYLLQATRVHDHAFVRSIDMQVMRLRRKLGDAEHGRSIIRAERGVGYVFTLSVEAS